MNPALFPAILDGLWTVTSVYEGHDDFEDKDDLEDEDDSDDDDDFDDDDDENDAFGTMTASITSSFGLIRQHLVSLLSPLTDSGNPN